MYLGDLRDLNLLKTDSYVMRIMLVAARKSITQKWLIKKTHTINEWIDLIYKIFIMERITFKLNLKMDIFNEYWSKWLKYIQAVRPDFV